MKQITLEQPIEVLEVNYKDVSFKMPLAGSIPFVEMIKFKNAKSKDEKLEAMIKLLEKYIPQEVFSKLTGSELNQIMTAWSNASEIDTGVTPGES